MAALDEAVRRNPPPEEIASLRLELLALDENWPQVAIEAEARLTTVPDDGHTLELLARAHLQQYQCATATTTARRWRDAAPDNPDAITTWGLLAEDAASLCEAGAQLCAIAQTGDDVQLGMALIRDGDWPVAACVLTRAAAEDAASSEARAWLGEALAQIGHPAEARPHFLKAVALAPESPLPWLLLGIHDLRQQQTGSAMDALLRAHTLDPTNPAPCLALAEVKAQAGDYDEVDMWITAALNIAPTDAEIAKAAAHFYLERHLIQEEYPIRAIQSAIQLAPDDGEARMLLGWFRLMTEDSAGARAALNEAVTLSPNLGQAHYLRGQALQATGDREAAQSAFIRAADLGYRP